MLILIGTNLHGLQKNYQFVDSLMRGFDNFTLQMNGRFPFSVEPNFVVKQTHEKPRNLVPN